MGRYKLCLSYQLGVVYDEKNRNNNIFCFHCKDIGQIVFFNVKEGYESGYLESSYYTNGYLNREYNYSANFDLPEVDVEFLKLIGIKKDDYYKYFDTFQFVYLG